ncbi:MAG: proton-conducting transporter membrane subunit, partial [Roseiflexaceae bacterium]|nr:proton-conducting transporter membrane subunit [Roseiflexaceae bacterium]
MPLVILTAVMAPVAMLASFGITERVKLYIALMFLLEAAMLGYFLALNFFFFFIFWEFSLVPAYFLIQGWGRRHAADSDPERRRRDAALKFFVYTMAGSIGMLLLFQFFYVATAAAGIPTFDLITLARLGQGLTVERAPLDPVDLTLREIIFNYVEQLGIADVLGR